MAYDLLLLSTSFVFFLIVAATWSVIWKGIALWTAARNSQRTWFVFLLIFNTLGVLEILYLVFFIGKKQILVKKRRKN